MKSKLWLWLAFLGAVSGGASRVIDECHRVDARLAFRGGYAGSRDAGATDANVRRYVDELPGAACWVYWLPGALDSQVTLCRRFYDLGVRRFILNPEIEWKANRLPNNNAVARAHVERLRREFPDCQLDYAPFALARWHADYPYPGFAGLDRSIAQLYFHEFGGKAPAEWVRLYREQLSWARAQWPELSAQTWHAMGDLYGSALGSVWRMPAPPPRAWSADDHSVWADATLGEPERHLYTIDAALAEGAPWRDLVSWVDAQTTAGRMRPAIFDERPFEQSVNNAGDVVNDLFGYRPSTARAVDSDIIEPSPEEIAHFGRYRGDEYQHAA